MRNPRGTVYAVTGHSCYRGQITLDGRTYYKYFSGSKRECSRQCLEWQEAMLRKDYCTYRQGMGADTKAVSLSMGHADIKVTQQHYTDAQQEALRQAREQEERDNLLALEKFEVPLKYEKKEK